MNDKLVNSERMAGALDNIITENHQIVTSIIAHYKDPNKETLQEKYKQEQDERYDRLGSLYQAFRDEIKIALNISDEITRMNYSGYGYSDGALEELVFESREGAVGSIIQALGEKIQKDFLSMNFIPIKYVNDDTTTIIPSVYAGKPEESLRAYEYAMLIKSLTSQFNIVDLENFMSTRDLSSSRLPYSLISIIIDEVSDKAAYREAQTMYENFAKNSRENKKDNPHLRPSDRLNKVLEDVDFKAMEEEYKRRFVEQEGVLNSRTSYSEKLSALIETGTFPAVTRMPSSEIDDRVTARINEYRNNVKETVKKFITETKGISAVEQPSKKNNQRNQKKKKISSDEAVR